MSIVFGSPEAKAILEKDKELQRKAEEEDDLDSLDALMERREDIESEIEDLEDQIGHLEDELQEVEAKIAEAKGNSSAVKVKTWNAWAKGVTA